MTKHLCSFSQEHRWISACTYRRKSINLDWLLVTSVFLSGGRFIPMKVIKKMTIVAGFDFRVFSGFPFLQVSKSLEFELDLRCYMSEKLYNLSLSSLTNMPIFWSLLCSLSPPSLLQNTPAPWLAPCIERLTTRAGCENLKKGNVIF